MSFAVEFYQALSATHRLVVRTFLQVFPNPLAVAPGALRRAKLRSEGVRGSMVEGDAGQGRLVGRHPTRGDAVIAWNADAYEAMCDAFDQENAARIVAWQRASQRLAFSGVTCARWALRADQNIKVLMWVFVVFSTLVSAFWGVEYAIAAAMGSIMVGLVLQLFLSVSLLLLGAGAGVGLAVGVGLWGRRQARQATVTDEAGRASAAQIVAAMQHQHQQPRAEAAAVRASVQREGDQGGR